MAALQKVVFQKQLLEDIGKLSEFCHTGDLEVFHSSLLRWLPKRLSFSYRGTMVRTQLAALHHNFNVGRKQATTADGRKKWKVIFPKSKRRWVAKKENEPTIDAPLFDLMEDIYLCAVTMWVEGKTPEFVEFYPAVPPTDGMTFLTPHPDNCAPKVCISDRPQDVGS